MTHLDVVKDASMTGCGTVLGLVLVFPSCKSVERALVDMFEGDVRSITDGGLEDQKEPRQ